MNEIVAQKQCAKCRQIKSVNDFCRSKLSKDGLAYSCKKCVYEVSKIWAERNPEKVNAKHKRWRAKNIESNKIRCKTWRENNEQKIREYDKNYRESHKAERALHQRNRKARERSNGGDITVKEWEDLKKKYGYRCLCCGRTDRTLTMDHVTPLSRGGAHRIENIEPLCKPCNSTKNNKIIDYRPKE